MSEVPEVHEEPGAPGAAAPRGALLTSGQTGLVLVFGLWCSNIYFSLACPKAKQIADVMGVVLGSVVYVADNTAEPLSGMAQMMKSYAEMDVGTSVMAGELDIQVSLQVVFDIATG